MAISLLKGELDLLIMVLRLPDKCHKKVPSKLDCANSRMTRNVSLLAVVLQDQMSTNPKVISRTFELRKTACISQVLLRRMLQLTIRSLE